MFNVLLEMKQVVPKVSSVLNLPCSTEEFVALIQVLIPTMFVLEILLSLPPALVQQIPLVLQDTTAETVDAVHPKVSVLWDPPWGE